MNRLWEVSPVSEWCIIQRKFDVKSHRHYESLFTIGNGYMSLRGAFEEGLPDDPQNLDNPRQPQIVTLEKGRASKQMWGTYVPSLFGSHPYCGNEMINLPFFLGMQFQWENVTLDLENCSIENYARWLDLRDGTLYRNFRWRHRDGQFLEFRFMRFCSLAVPHLCVQVCEIDAPGGFETTSLSVSSAIDSDIRTNGYDHLTPMRMDGDARGRINLDVLTDAGDRVAIVSQMVLETLHAADDNRTGWQPAQTARSISTKINLPIQAEQKIRLIKYSALHTSYDPRTANPDQAAEETLRQALNSGLLRLIQEHKTGWQDRWAQMDIRIDGDPETQRSLRFTAFHLNRALNASDPRTGICAKCNSGEAYWGHSFWDTEVFILPFFIYTRPDAARNLLLYRYDKLDGAREKAKQNGYPGAMYPWESDRNGHEACSLWEFAELEVHVVADVAYGIRHYMAATQDFEFLYDFGTEMLIEIARFWRARIHRASDGTAHILGVMGPNEYNPLVHDNYYTNWMARLALRSMIWAVDLMRKNAPRRWDALVQQLAFDPAEIESFETLAENLVLPFDESRNLVLQSADFETLEPLNFDEVWKDRRQPLGRFLSHERLTRSRCFKQADALLTFDLFPYAFTREQLRVAYQYYEPLTCHDSSLSVATHGSLVTRLNRHQEAWRYFRQAAQMDLGNTLGNAAEGLHAACLGATWRAAIFGFIGFWIDIEREKAGFDPHLPAHWKRVDFNFIIFGRTLAITLTQQKIQLCLLSGAPLELEIATQLVRLDPEKKITVEIRASDESASPRFDGQRPVGILADLTEREPMLRFLKRISGDINLRVCERDDAFESFSAIWIHYLHDADPLPVQSQIKLKRFIDNGGKVILTGSAVDLVSDLGIDSPPEIIRYENGAELVRDGFFAIGEHPLLIDESAKWRLCNQMSVPSARLSYWNSLTESAQILASHFIDGRNFPERSVFIEWQIADGLILAIGLPAIQFKYLETHHAYQCHLFFRRLLGYASKSCHIASEWLIDGEAPALSGFLKDRYQMQGLAVTPGGKIAIRMSIDCFQNVHLRAALDVTDGNGKSIDREFKEPMVETGRDRRLVLSTKPLPPSNFRIALSVEDGSGSEKRIQMTKNLLVCPSEKDGWTRLGSVHSYRNSELLLQIDAESGHISSIRNTAAAGDLEFAANETNNPLFEADTPRLGHLFFKTHPYTEEWGIRTTTWDDQNTLDSGDIRKAEQRGGNFTITYQGQSGQTNGLKNLEIVQHFSPQSDGTFRWTVQIKNTARHALEIGDFMLPLSLNTHFSKPDAQSQIYENRLMMHNHVAGYSSFLFATALNGRGKKLLILPDENTALECMAHDQRKYGGVQPKWEGLVYIYLYSAASRYQKNWLPWYNGHHSMVLQAGETRHFGFTFYWIDSPEDISEIRQKANQVVVETEPGYVIPIDHRTQLKIKGHPVDRIELPQSAKVKRLNENRFEIEWTELGEIPLRIYYGTDRWTIINFRIIPPVGELIGKRAQFIREYQQYREPRAYKDGIFYMWDAEDKKQVREDRFQFKTGGSDELGFADPLYLAGKNMFYPDPREVEALEYYIHHFLRRVIQRPDYGVIRYASADGNPDREGQRTDRSFNYAHVMNIYFCMYEIGRRFDVLQQATHTEYLEHAYGTAMAYMTLPMYENSNLTQGNTNDNVLVKIAEALKAEGCTTQYEALTHQIERKSEYMRTASCPYASEYTFDTTGYEGVYWLRKYGGDAPGMEDVMHTIRATRGSQPHWIFYGNDTRWGWGNSKIESPDEICYNYMAPLNGRVMLDAFLYFSKPEDLRQGFAATVGTWCLVEPDGTAHDFCGWEPCRRIFDPWSSEMGVGLYATLLCLGAYVYDDSNCLGGQLIRESYGWQLKPYSGFGTRIWIAEFGKLIEIEGGVFQVARLNREHKTLEVVFKREARARKVQLIISNRDIGMKAYSPIQRIEVRSGNKVLIALK
ncbi:glycoside hydrolase family 65 protein [candidate division KSB1 bacterium]|nr:glycoside hydrolase family 65 protein [candidate division KSB1 bacterium]